MFSYETQRRQETYQSQTPGNNGLRCLQTPGSLPRPRVGAVAQASVLRIHPSSCTVPRGHQQKTPKFRLTDRKRRRGEGGSAHRGRKIWPKKHFTAIRPHLGPQGWRLVRLTQPISPHVRAPLVQEGRVQDISEVSVQSPLSLCRDTATGPRTDSQGGRGESRKQTQSQWPTRLGPA